MVKEKWQQASRYVSSFIHKLKARKTEHKLDQDRDEHGQINLDPVIYAELERRANQEGVSVEAIIYQAIEYYQAGQSEQDYKFSVERKEKNPILLLDGLAKLEPNQKQAEAKEEESHDSRQPANW